MNHINTIITRCKNLISNFNRIPGKEFRIKNKYLKLHTTNPEDAKSFLLRINIENINFLERREVGILLLTHSNGKVSEIVKAERIFKLNLSRKKVEYIDYFWYGESLCYQGRIAETEKIFEKSLNLLSKHRDFNDFTKRQFIAHIYERYAQALQLNGKLDEAEINYQIALQTDEALKNSPHNMGGAQFNLDGLIKLKQSKQSKRRIYRWPVKLEEFNDLKKLVLKQFVQTSDKTNLIRQSTQILTLGSCFAQNLAIYLKKSGFNANSLGMGELINSTYANKYLIEWAISSSQKPVENKQVVKVLEHYYGGDPTHIRKLLETIDVLVFTLGVAPCFFNKISGDFYLSAPDVSTLHLLAENNYRTTTVDENINNILEIIQMVRKINNTVKFVFTVSPVPLFATFEYTSAIVADCVSKSILRASVDTVIRKEIPNIYYWPSFEIVRWLGAYNHSVYGAEDGTSRHISEWVIEIIIEAFLAAYSEKIDNL